jgi:hypothetical protein
MTAENSIKQQVESLNASFKFINSQYFKELVETTSRTMRAFQPIIEQNMRLAESLKPTIEQINSLYDSKALSSLQHLLNSHTLDLQYLGLATTLNKSFLLNINDYSQSISRTILAWQEDIHQEVGEKLKHRDSIEYNMWSGAWQALDSNNPDKSRHCACSMRELATKILHELAQDRKVRTKLNLPDDEKITRRQRIEYIVGNSTENSDIDRSSTIKYVFDQIDKLHKPTHSQGEGMTNDQIKQILISTEIAINILLKTIEETTLQ